MIPTPTPLPPPISTLPALDLGGNYTEQFAYNAVQLWAEVPTSLTEVFQLIIVLVILFGGIALIVRAVRSLDNAQS